MTKARYCAVSAANGLQTIRYTYKLAAQCMPAGSSATGSPDKFLKTSMYGAGMQALTDCPEPSKPSSLMLFHRLRVVRDSLWGCSLPCRRRWHGPGGARRHAASLGCR